MAGVFELPMEVEISAAHATSGKRAWIELAILVAAVMVLLMLAFAPVGDGAAAGVLDARRWP